MDTWEIFSKRYHLTAVFVLILASTVPYINALSNGFVYDDIFQIVENWKLSDLTNLFVFLQNPRGIEQAVFLAEYQIWGLNPFWFHLVNVILHTLCTLSLFFLLTKIFKSYGVPLITGLFFATHPIHIEVVTAIANCQDLLAMFFFMWSFIFYIMRKRSQLFYLLSLLSFLFSIFSKEGAVVTLPVMLILYDLYFTEEDSWDCLKNNLQYYVPYGLIIIIFLLYLRFILLIFPSSSIPEASSLFLHQSFPIYFYTACKAFLIYLRLILFPISLNADYVVPLSQSLFEWNVLISLASLILFLILTIKIYHFSKAISFGMAWFFVTLFPLSNLLLPITPHFVAERYLYLPSVGFCLIVAVIFKRLMSIERKYYKNLIIFILIIILGLYSGLTINRNLDWRSNYTLWSRTVKQSPISARAHNNLGAAYEEKGLLDNAMDEYRRALSLQPNDFKARNNLGYAYSRKGLLDEAIIEFKKGLRIRPNDASAHNNLGAAYEEKGLLDNAIDEYRRALSLRPNDFKAHINLGNAYSEKGLLDEAIIEFKKALRIRPDNALVHNNLGTAYGEKGLLNQAEAEFMEALRIRPDYLEVHNNLGNTYLEKGFLDQAIDEYKEVLKIDSTHVEAHYNLGLSYDKKGLWNDATNHYQRFLHLVPIESSIYGDAIDMAKSRIGVLKNEINLIK